MKRFLSILTALLLLGTCACERLPGREQGGAESAADVGQSREEWVAFVPLAPFDEGFPGEKTLYGSVVDEALEALRSLPYSPERLTNCAPFIRLIFSDGSVFELVEMETSLPAAAVSFEGGNVGQADCDERCKTALSALFALYKESPSPDSGSGDFSFSLTFGVYGISSYDSVTGRLVKTVVATHPEDYVTTLRLSEEQLSAIRQTIYRLDLSLYPTIYDPFADPESGNSVFSTPYATIRLIVRENGKTFAVSCPKICLGSAAEAPTDMGKAFLNAIEEIREILTGSEEWQALPMYEFLYY